MSFGFTRRFFGSIPKLPGDADRNEDAYNWSPGRRAMALSDGASESFDSRLWARILVRLFVLRRQLSVAWADVAIKAFAHRHDPGSMSWSRLAAFQRGSFSTLLGVDFSSDLNEAQIVAVGDTVAMLFDGPRLVESFPYTHPDDFQRRPTLLSTQRGHNVFLDKPDTPGQCRMSTTTWRLDQLAEPRIVCMTDAIAEWFLRHAVENPSAGELLLGLTEIDQLQALVLREREAGRMHVDDTTLLVLE